MQFRFATPDDSALLAPLNQALVFEEDASPIGYALFRREAEYVYLRQLFVLPEFRRKGVARAALHWLWRHAWSGAPRLRIEVLVENAAGREFWRAMGFREYCVT